MTIGEITALVLGSNGLWAVLTLIITRALNKKDKNSEEQQLQKNTIALLMYQAFSDKIERVLNQGYATPSDRQDVKNMHKKYKENGWNGDMDERIKRLYALPTKKLN
mgnify:FL=1